MLVESFPGLLGRRGQLLGLVISETFFPTVWRSWASSVTLLNMVIIAEAQVFSPSVQLIEDCLCLSWLDVNLDSILKSRDITLSTKGRLVKAMVFPVVTCGCESWTVKKAECRKIDAF